MRGPFLLSIFAISFLILTGCSVTSQADTAAYGTETQLIQMTVTTPTITPISLPTTTQITETQTATTNSKPASFSVSGLTDLPPKK